MAAQLSRALACALAGSLASGLLVTLAAPASADEKRKPGSQPAEHAEHDHPHGAPALEAQRDRVDRSISETLGNLDQSSSNLVAAADALAAAQVELNEARNDLAKARGELVAAKTLDRQMQRRLEAAVRRLRDARRELAAGQADVVDQEATLGQIAVQNYQNGDPALMGLSMVMTTQDPTGLTGQLNSVRSVLVKEAAILDRLEVSRILLEVQEEEVQQARRRVAVRRAEAAANLAVKKDLESAAEDAEARVAGLTKLREEAHAAAVSAREADLEQLRGLQQEQDRISDMLKQRAEEARLLAAAAAAAAASAEGAVDLGSRPSNGFLNYPVNSYVTSQYGMRFHPVYHRWSLHDGTDFGAPCGTPIRAAAGGTVLATYHNAGYGNRIIMDNGFHSGRGVGLGTSYNHLSSDSVSVGEKVKRGDIIGYVGNTGYSTGCHLHFMVFENGTAVNPMGWL